MASSLLDQVAPVPRKKLGALKMRGESLHKRLVSEDAKRKLGQAIERALELTGITKQQACRLMGYGDDQSPLSRWIAGVDNPQLALMLDTLGAAFRGALIVALAEQDHLAVEVATVVTVRRRRTA